MNDINANRTGFIGGSDARRIINGEWTDLWAEKTGRKEPDDLSAIFPVQLGKVTESFHRAWLVERHGLQIFEPAQPQFFHPDHPFMAAQLDGQIDDTFIELKHSNERQTIESATLYYLPQLAHYCAVLGGNYCWMSVIPGNQAPVFSKITIPADYIAHLTMLELEFWWHVTTDTRPSDRPASGEAGSLAAGVLIDEMRSVDMTGNNQWSDMARTLIETKPAADMHEAAKKDIKSLVDADVREATGHGVTIKRDKRGSLRLYIKEKEDA